MMVSLAKMEETGVVMRAPSGAMISVATVHVVGMVTMETVGMAMTVATIVAITNGIGVMMRSPLACVELKDFEKLDKMYDIDWKKMHDQICKYKKTYVYALLYGNWKGLDHWTHAYLKNKKISDLRQSFPADYKPQFCMEGKNTYGHTVRFEFVDVNRIDSFLNKYRSASGNARVVPDEPSN
uniref:Uncharacterized protein n=1 Tax=Oryza brachyantha TaxID=4533 RepID=J3KZK9_ORYBR